MLNRMIWQSRNRGSELGCKKDQLGNLFVSLPDAGISGVANALL
jgi:hypothetical protein